MPDHAIRIANETDVPAIVALLADDPLGATREAANEPGLARYMDAFKAIETDPNNELVVITDGPQVVGCLQLTLIPGLSRSGMWRAQVEAVRVAGTHRGAKLGHKLMEWVIRRARDKGCGLVQLTTDKTRGEAHRFYESLGFVASHEGMKLGLS